MKKAEIKAVELVRRIRDEQHEALKDKTAEERRAFYRERARRVHERLGVTTEETAGA